MSVPLELKRTTDPPAAANGYLAELGVIYDAIDNDAVQTEVFDVEGSHAAVRYRRMLLKDRLRTQGSEGELWERNAQFLIEACDEILIRDPETGTLEPLVPGKRVTFDWNDDTLPLHEALGKHETDVRRSVLRLFQGVDHALLRHAEAVDGWMGRADTKTAEKFAGG